MTSSVTKVPAQAGRCNWSKIMSTICIVCYILLMVTGVQFVRGKTGLARLFTGVLIFEVVYFFSVAMMWLMPKIGMSVAAASGVANGGLAFQIITLFPLWAPFTVRWAIRNQEELSDNSMQETLNGAPDG